MTNWSAKQLTLRRKVHVTAYRGANFLTVRLTNAALPSPRLLPELMSDMQFP